MRERAHAKSDKGISGAAALAVKIDCLAAALFFPPDWPLYAPENGLCKDPKKPL